jgi:hypothetical protein
MLPGGIVLNGESDFLIAVDVEIGGVGLGGSSF